MFISMQKINFITHFFLEILQRYCIILVIWVLLACLGILITYNSINLYKTSKFICTKNQLQLLLLSWVFAKILNTWLLWPWLAMPTEIESPLVSGFDVYLHAENQIHPSLLSRDTAMILQNCYSGYFGHAWLSPWIKSWWLSSWKSGSSFLKFCQDLANLSFWIFCACLTTPTKNKKINLKETLMFI